MMVRPLQADNALADRLQISGFLLKSDYPISFDFIVSRTIRLSIRTSTAQRTGCAALANLGAIKNKPLTAGCKDTDSLGQPACFGGIVGAALRCRFAVIRCVRSRTGDS